MVERRSRHYVVIVDTMVLWYVNLGISSNVWESVRAAAFPGSQVHFRAGDNDKGPAYGPHQQQL